MKKYIVTEKHQSIKNGIILAQHSDASSHFFLANTEVHFTQDVISNWVSAGWLIEYDTKEFTWGEMISDELLSMWIKENKK